MKVKQFFIRVIMLLALIVCCSPLYNQCLAGPRGKTGGGGGGGGGRGGVSVPEPSSLVLLAAGGGALYIVRRWRKK